MSSCPSLTLTVPDESNEVQLVNIAPSLTLGLPLVSELSVDTTQATPYAVINNACTPNLTFYAVEGASPWSIYETGRILDDKINVASGYLYNLISNNVAGVVSLNSRSGALFITGQSGIFVSVQGQTIYVSENITPKLTSLSGFTTGVSGYLQNQIDNGTTSSALTQTGIVLLGVINDTGSNLYNQLYNSGQLLFNRDFSISGVLQDYINQQIINTGSLLYSQTYNTGQLIYQLLTGFSGYCTNNFATISNLSQTGAILFNIITGQSGSNTNFVQTGSELLFITGIPTGFDTLYINFKNYTFANIPKIFVSLETSNTIYSYGVLISGKSTTGFWSLFTDTIDETGLFLQVLAKI